VSRGRTVRALVHPLVELQIHAKSAFTDSNQSESPAHPIWTTSPSLIDPRSPGRLASGPTGCRNCHVRLRSRTFWPPLRLAPPPSSSLRTSRDARTAGNVWSCPIPLYISGHPRIDYARFDNRTRTPNASVPAPGFTELLTQTSTVIRRHRDTEIFPATDVTLMDCAIPRSRMAALGLKAPNSPK